MRLTFSKSLAIFLCGYDKTYTYRKFKFKVGDRVDDPSKSKNCLYAIVSYTGYVLRMATTYERAKALVDDEYRYIFEAHLVL